MADKSIFELNLQTTFATNDRLVVGNYANSDAEAITGQTLVNLLATSLDGHGGIQSIVKTSSTGTDPVVDTYTITLSDTSTTTFQITNGLKGDQGNQTYVYFRWAHTEPSSWSDTTSQPDEWMGVYAGTATTPPTTVSAYTWVQVRGEKGDTGDASTITNQGVTYQTSSSGTVAPSGSWTTSIPAVAPGEFLWTRTQLTFNDGTTITAYGVSRYGIDGTGAVSSINVTCLPDTNGNVTVTASDVPTLDSTSVQAHLTSIETDIANIQPKLIYPRPNLLDNWYFVGGGSQQGGGQFPINSRGQTSYTGASYWIDRWISTDGNLKCNVNSDSIRLTKASLNGQSPLIQVVPHNDLVGKTVTVSILYRGSISGTARFIFPWSSQYDLTSSDDWTLYSATGTAALRTFGNFTNVILTGVQLRSDFTLNSYLDIAAIKLELGSTQTLAHQENGTWVLNEIPDYEEQLIRCQTSTADSADYYANQKVMTNQMVTNPNLLDNWYFVGGGSQLGDGIFPINQRGQTSYTSASQYSIDRWKLGGAHPVEVLSTGVKITCNSSTSVNNALVQPLANLPPGVYTMSALIIENTTTNGFLLRFNTSTASVSSGIGLFSRTFTASSDIATVSLQFTDRSNDNGNYITVAAIKLERGATQTLAHQENGVWVLNEIPNFEEQLIRCSASVDSTDTYANKTVAYAPKKASVTISSSSWSGSNPYTQTVSISGAVITSKTKVDIQPDATALAQLISDGVTALYISNNNGTLTAYSIGAATTANITVQVTYYETE